MSKFKTTKKNDLKNHFKQLHTKKILTAVPAKKNSLCPSRDKIQVYWLYLVNQCAD